MKALKLQMVGRWFPVLLLVSCISEPRNDPHEQTIENLAVQLQSGEITDIDVFDLNLSSDTLRQVYILADRLQVLDTDLGQIILAAQTQIQPRTIMQSCSGITPTSADRAWWRGLTQQQRNIEILTRAYRDNGVVVGIQCKPWVQRVVPEASSCVASVPPTCNPDGTTINAYGWVWCTNFSASQYAIGMSTDIAYVQPGWIIQMNWTSGGSTTPHTAIVESVGSSGLYVIDSNWVGQPQIKNKVGVHYWSFSEFRSSVGSKYSVYRIGGGNP